MKEKFAQPSKRLKVLEVLFRELRSICPEYLLYAVNLALVIEPFGALNGKLVSFERSAEVKRTEKKCENTKMMLSNEKAKR